MKTTTKTRKRLVRLDPNDSRHGTINAYNNFSCRCGKCREANRIHMAGRRKKHGELMRAGLAPDYVRHGLGSTYRNWECRCGLCTTAHREDVLRSKVRGQLRQFAALLQQLIVKREQHEEKDQVEPAIVVLDVWDR